jgi:hypothetical protein
MAQFGRPSADTLRDNWEEDDATTTNIFDQIDEAVADDNDYIQTGIAPTNDVYVTALTSVEDPISSTGHVVRWRHRKSAAGGAQIDLTVQLRQGYTNEGSMGTLIAAVTRTNISDSITADTFTLTGGEADSITNYASLYIRFVANQV